MLIHHLVLDEFFDAPYELRDWAIGRGFRTEVSPIDQMEYTGVCKDPPWCFRQEAELKLSVILARAANIRLSFLRLTTTRERDPQRRIIHLDAAYANCLLTVYLNPPFEFPSDAGTMIYKHRETGMDSIPRTQDEVDVWTRDCNSLHLWDIIGGASQAWNRAIIMPTNKFHASMPTQGYGMDATDGRLVFVAFFDI